MNAPAQFNQHADQHHLNPHNFGSFTLRALFDEARLLMCQELALQYRLAAVLRELDARALGTLPLIDAPFRDGELSCSKVRALTRAATTENEEQLLTLSRGSESITGKSRCRSGTNAPSNEHRREAVRDDKADHGLQAFGLSRAIWRAYGSASCGAELPPEDDDRTSRCYRHVGATRLITEIHLSQRNQC